MEITTQQRNELINRALEARRFAYAPYSGYTVGAALLSISGEIYHGVNIENAAYPTSMCAERTAVFKAVSNGELAFSAIAIATENGGSPCGACRQVLSEFGLETLVLVVDSQGEVTLETTVGNLLPEAFGPSDLTRG
ncbi:MAG: cytidine deaminase [Anaerolineales bacterium]|nr:MAG: cytidine deaminase [Anaerolineales bacterium]